MDNKFAIDANRLVGQLELRISRLESALANAIIKLDGASQDFTDEYPDENAEEKQKEWSFMIEQMHNVLINAEGNAPKVEPTIALDNTRLTPGEQFIVDWQFRLTGDFRTALANAIRTADSSNLDLLAQGFPDEVDGYRKFHNEAGWWQRTMDKAKTLGHIPGDAR